MAEESLLHKLLTLKFLQGNPYDPRMGGGFNEPGKMFTNVSAPQPPPVPTIPPKIHPVRIPTDINLPPDPANYAINHRLQWAVHPCSQQGYRVTTLHSLGQAYRLDQGHVRKHHPNHNHPSLMQHHRSQRPHSIRIRFLKRHPR
jgi:hypothetical protein